MQGFVVRRRRLLAGLVALGALSTSALAQDLPRCHSSADYRWGAAYSSLVNAVYGEPSQGVRRHTTAEVRANSTLLDDQNRRVRPNLVLRFDSDGRITETDLKFEYADGPVYNPITHTRDKSGLVDGLVRFEIDGRLDPQAVAQQRPVRSGQPRFDSLSRDLRVAFIRPGSGTTWLTFSRSDLAEAARAARSQQQSLNSAYNQRRCASFDPSCFLTTAAVQTIGLDDDCWELATLRRFRDGWLARQSGGAEDIARYYADAPAIAEALRAEPRKLARIYFTGILPSAIAAHLGLNRVARAIYSRQMRALAAAA